MKKLMVLIVLVFLLGTTVGCGNGVEQNTGVIEEVTESRGIVDDCSDKLTLFDKNIKVPTTLKELGSEYRYSDIAIEYKDDNGNQCVQTVVYKEDIKIMYVDLIDTTQKEMNENSIIYRIGTRSEGDIIKLNGLYSGVEKEEVRKMLGEPSKINVGDFDFEQWLYYNERGRPEYEVLDVAFNKGKLSSTIIMRYPLKYR